MGIYNERVLPRLLDKALGTDEVAEWRRRCVEGLSGVVVEPGFGSGLNIEWYPAEVTKVYAVDPAMLGRQLAAKRIEASPVEIEFIGLDGQAIPLDDATCDAGLVTFSLCTIADPERAVAELHRVVKPGGRLHFVEHGQAPDAGVQRWQRRLEPMQRRLFDGCHLTRDIPAIVEGGGFAIEEIDARYVKGPKPHSWFSVGRAMRR
ncbi:MAG: class I SAM-dependent methyltransferase [Actinomycetota bacterium]